MQFPWIILRGILEIMTWKEITSPPGTNNQKGQVMLNIHRLWVHDLRQPKPQRQTLMSKAKIPLALSLQASLPPRSAGEDVAEKREVRETEQRLAKRVNVTAVRRE